MKSKKAEQIGLFSRVSPETKAMYEDIVYSLDAKANEVMETIIRYYYEKEGVPTRPSRKRTAKN